MVLKFSWFCKVEVGSYCCFHEKKTKNWKSFRFDEILHRRGCEFQLFGTVRRIYSPIKAVTKGTVLKVAILRYTFIFFELLFHRALPKKKSYIANGHIKSKWNKKVSGGNTLRTLVSKKMFLQSRHSSMTAHLQWTDLCEKYEHGLTAIYSAILCTFTKRLHVYSDL